MSEKSENKLQGTPKNHLPKHPLKKIFNAHTPYRLVILIALCVFVGETSEMFVLASLPFRSIWLHTILDATLLIILLSPALYYLVTDLSRGTLPILS